MEKATKCYHVDPSFHSPAYAHIWTNNIWTMVHNPNPYSGIGATAQVTNMT